MSPENSLQDWSLGEWSIRGLTGRYSTKGNKQVCSSPVIPKLLRLIVEKLNTPAMLQRCVCVHVVW